MKLVVECLEKYILSIGNGNDWQWNRLAMESVGNGIDWQWDRLAMESVGKGNAWQNTSL